MQIRDNVFNDAANRLGFIIDRSFMGFPIKDKDDEHKKARGAILLWTSAVNRLNKDRYNFVISMADYLYKSLEWNNKIENDYNENL